MSAPGQEAGAGAVVSSEQEGHVVHSCNFRYAGRLSNENARTLTSLHEKLALNVSNALQLYLGASLVRLKLVSLEQKSMQDYLKDIASSSFLVPCALNVLQSKMLMHMDNSLVFPMIDLLLGGTGAAGEATRELTDIDEDIMESVSSLIVQQIERTWSSLNLTLSLGRAIKSTAVPQVFANEKLVLLIFEFEVGEIRGPFTLVLPTSFVGFLLRHLKVSQTQKALGLRTGPEPTLRQRMLDCRFQVAADIPQMRVGVRGLVGLAPGMILKLNTAVKASGKLTVENIDIYEALPVRSGTSKAAQVVARLTEPALNKEQS